MQIVQNSFKRLYYLQTFIFSANYKESKNLYNDFKKTNEDKKMNNTYKLYGSVLKGTPFAEITNGEAYIPYSEDLSVLGTKVNIGKFTSSNSIE